MDVDPTVAGPPEVDEVVDEVVDVVEVGPVGTGAGDDVWMGPDTVADLDTVADEVPGPEAGDQLVAGPDTDSAPKTTAADPAAAGAPAGDHDGLRTELDALGGIEAELADVELALRRLDDGSYGRCEVCDGVIDEARLTEAPAARFCRAHLPIALS